MGKIVIQASSRFNLGSWAIGWLENTGVKDKRFSHVDAVLPGWMEKTGWLLGARSQRVSGIPAGTQIRPPDYYRFNRKLLITIQCTYKQEHYFYDWLVEQIGTPYDERAILAFIFDRNWRDDSAWICSELIAAGLERVGVFPYCLFLPANKITPGGLIFVVSAITEV